MNQDDPILDPDFDDEAAAQEDTALAEPSPPEEERPVRFALSSYGWDSDVDGLVRRMNRGDIFIPGFQRGFVWTNPERSRFIESLILGLPVPNIFLAQDGETKKLNVVDGQQRLRSLQEYLAGHFALSGQGLQEELTGCYYNREVAKGKKSKILSDEDARALSDALVHSVVIKPDPADDDEQKGHEYNRAVIQIFRRLNTSGKPLQAQEIRASVFHGPFNDLLIKLNKDENWRQLFGPVHSRLRDVELILRYISLLEEWETYKAPMPKFLDDYMEKQRYISDVLADELSGHFAKIAQVVVEKIGVAAFKRRGTFHVSHFDAMFVGATAATRDGRSFTGDEFGQKWDQLEKDERFQWATAEFVNDTNRVQTRMARATEVFCS